jgi:adenylate cyclase
MEQLSQYFDSIAALIHKYDGTIDKYIGDSVMAFWGVSLASSEQAQHACRAAIDIITAIRELNEKWRQQGREIFATRIGINTGVSLVGNFGSSDRFNYTAIGDSVNIASRLEGLNKLYETEIIVSESTANAAGADFVFRPLDLVVVKGRQGSVKVYQLLGLAVSPEAERWQTVSRMSVEALESYLNRDWRTSYEQFQALLEILGEDPAAEMYMSRCRELHANPPGADWDGVFRVQSK